MPYSSTCHDPFSETPTLAEACRLLVSRLQPPCK
jgi:hypothetical protein